MRAGRLGREKDLERAPGAHAKAQRFLARNCAIGALCNEFEGVEGGAGGWRRLRRGERSTFFVGCCSW